LLAQPDGQNKEGASYPGLKFTVASNVAVIPK
jgi:hypothetical protein